MFLLSLLDLPFSISPVVTGLMLTLLFGRNGWFGPLLKEMGINVVFAFAGAPRTAAIGCAEGRGLGCGHNSSVGMPSPQLCPTHRAMRGVLLAA